MATHQYYFRYFVDRFQCLLFFVPRRPAPAGTILLLYMRKSAIIIPCYNEAARIRKDRLVDFLRTRPDTRLYFVNDGSTDQTGNLLQDFISGTGISASLTNLKKNEGKGGAVRAGVLAALEDGGFDFIGYLDADLSTTPEEFYEMYQWAINNNLDYIFGSRVRMQGHTIKRNAFRHAAGRLVTTLIDRRFRLGIYDTQCGAKWFSSACCSVLFREPFKTRWLFDVELFLRIRQLLPEAKGFEYPLKNWENEKGSKISVLSSGRIWNEIRLLKKHYR